MEDQIIQEIPSWFGPGMVLFFIILGLWSAVWKAIALWKSARLDSKVWFVIMFILNTAGILEIIYIFAVARPKEKGNPTIAKPPQV